MRPHTHQVLTAIINAMAAFTTRGQRVVPVKTVASWHKALSLAAKIDPLYVPTPKASTGEPA